MASPKTPSKASVYQPGFLDSTRDIKPSVERELKRISEAMRILDEKSGLNGAGGIPPGLQIKYNPDGTATFTHPDPNDPSKVVTTIVDISGEDNLVNTSTSFVKVLQDLQDLADKLTQEAKDRVDQDTLLANQLATEAQTRADNDATLANNLISGLTNEENARTAAILAETQARTAALQAETQARGQAISANEALWRTAVSDQKTYIDNANSHLVDMISNISAGTGDAFDPANIWFFDTTTQGWTANPGTISVDSDGWLHPAGSGTVDAILESPPSSDTVNWTPFSSAAYRYMRLRIKRIGNPVWKGDIGWRSASDTGYPTANTVTIPEPDPSVWSKDGDITTIDVHDIPWNSGTVDQIKIDLTAAGTAGDLIVYDWIAIGRPTPGAGMAALQKESLARQSGDQAEAASRETLVTNLTGGYGSAVGENGALPTTGNGILFEERKLWQHGDTIEAGLRVDLETKVDNNKNSADQELLTLTNKTNSNATAITNLQNTVNGDPANPGSGLSTAVNTLTSKVTKNEGDITSLNGQVTNLQSSISNQSGVNLFPGGTFENYTDGQQVNQTLPSGQANKWLVATDSAKFEGNRGATATRGAPQTDTVNEMLVGTQQRGRRGAWYYAEVYAAKNPASTQTTGILKFGIKSTSANGAQNVLDGINIDVATLTTAFQKYKGYFQCSYQPNVPVLTNPGNEITKVQPVFWFPGANNSAGVSVLIDNAYVIEASGEAASDANTKAIATLQTSTSTNAGNITAVSDRTTTLETDVSGIKTSKADQSAVDSLTQKVETNEQGISTVQANYTALNTRVGSAEVSVADLIAKGDNYILNGTFPNDSHDWDLSAGAEWKANTGDGKSGFTLTRDATNTSPTITNSRTPATSGRYYRAVIRMKASVADTVVTVRNNFATNLTNAPFDAFDRTVKVGTSWADYDITWHNNIDGSGPDKQSPDTTNYLFLSIINSLTDGEVIISSVYLFDDTGNISNSATATALETLTNEVHDTSTGLSSTSNKLITLSNQVIQDSRLKDAAGPNLFPDGTFESYVVGNLPNTSSNAYTQIVLKNSTSTQEPQPHFGTKCLQFTRPTSTGGSTHTDVFFGNASVINPTTGATSKEQRYFTVRSGASYTFEGWVKLVTAPTTAGVTLRIGLNTQKSDGTEDHTGALEVTVDPTTPLGVWTKYSKTIKLSDLAVQSRVYMTTLSVNDTPNVGAVFLVDDLYVSESTDAVNVGAGNASAISDLKTDVSSANGRIDSQANSITSLTSQVTGAKTDPQNMVTNGDFSATKPGDFWTFGSTTTFPADDADRGVCAQLSATNANTDLVQSLRVRANRTYRASCVYKFSDTAVIADANNTKLQCNTSTNAVLGAVQFAKGTGTQTWNSVNFEFTPSSDFSITLYARANLSAGVVRVDNIRLEDVTDVKTLGQHGSAITSLQSRTTAAEGKILTNQSSITRLEASIGSPSLEAIYNWEFDKDQDYADWVLANGTLTKKPSVASIKPVATSTRAIDPTFINNNINFVGSVYNTVKIRMRAATGTVPNGTSAELYFRTTALPGYAGDRMYRFDISGMNTTWKIFTLDFSVPSTSLTAAAIAAWNASPVIGLRLDPTGIAAPDIEVDFITVGKVGNTGSVSAINTITTHLESSDEAIAAAQLAQAEGFNQQRAQIGANDTKITVTQTSIATLESAMSSRIVALEAKTDTTNASITNLTKVVADNKSAASTEVNTLKSTVNGNKTDIEAKVSTTNSTIATLTGKLNAQWGVTATVKDGSHAVVGGIALGVDNKNGSAFIVQADKFQVWNQASAATAGAGQAPFTVTGGKVFINSAVIADATITNAMISSAGIDWAKIKNVVIDDADIANASISFGKIKNVSISNAMIDSAGINWAKIKGVSIVDAQIASLTVGKLSGDVAKPYQVKLDGNWGNINNPGGTVINIPAVSWNRSMFAEGGIVVGAFRVSSVSGGSQITWKYGGGGVRVQYLIQGGAWAGLTGASATANQQTAFAAAGYGGEIITIPAGKSCQLRGQRTYTEPGAAPTGCVVMVVKG